MKVLFIQNVENQKAGDIKEVPDGYARNYLLKKGLAVAASEDKVKELGAQIEKIKKDEEKKSEELTKQAEKIEAVTFTVSVQAGDEGKLFGAVTNRDLADALAAKKFTVDKHDIEILEPIHDLGEHEATVKLGHGVHAKMKVIVERAA
jgi:large subunit ribosomal protein L9